MRDSWLLIDEPDLYRANIGHDPYSIWVTKLVGLELKKLPARLLAYANDDHSKAHVIYLDGERDIVFKEQMSFRAQGET